MASSPKSKVLIEKKPTLFRMTQEKLNELYKTHFDTGYSQCLRDYRDKFKAEEASLAEQKARLNKEQTQAVTDLMRACSENLSKAGYLIGKLNKDNSR